MNEKGEDAMQSELSAHSILRVMGLATAVLVVAACAAGPMTSRTGTVQDIVIEEGPEPTELTVNAGDEVRWINRRTEFIQIDLVNFDPNTLSCNRWFSNFLGGGREFAVLQANETVSACFSISGSVRYNIRMETALSAGMKIVPGVIRVGN